MLFVLKLYKLLFIISRLKDALNNKQDVGTFGSGYFTIGDTLICYGSTVVGGSSGTSGAMSIASFPKAFSIQPVVVASPATNTPTTLTIAAFNTQTTQVELYSIGTDNSWYTGGVNVLWIAIGKK